MQIDELILCISKYLPQIATRHDDGHVQVEEELWTLNYAKKDTKKYIQLPTIKLLISNTLIYHEEELDHLSPLKDPFLRESQVNGRLHMDKFLHPDQALRKYTLC